METEDTDCYGMSTKKMDVLLQRISVDSEIDKSSECPMEVETATIRVEPVEVENPFLPD